MKYAVIFILLLIITLNGCAIGNIGALVAKVQKSGNVQIVNLHVIGLHFRKRMDDTGAQIGYSKRRYIFSDEVQIEPGVYFFHVPLPNIESIGQDFISFGIDISTTSPDQGINFGYQHKALYVRIDPWESYFISLERNTPKLIKIGKY